MRSERRQEALAGYALIAVPLALFLVLQSGRSSTRATSACSTGASGGPRRSWASPTTSTSCGIRCSSRRSPNTAYYTLLVVPIQMIIGLFLAVIVNQKLRGQTFFRAAFYFPAIASSAAITVLFLFILAPERPVQRGARGARLQPVVRGPRLRAEPQLVRRPAGRR